MSKLVYKICTQEEWDAAESSGAYGGSADDLRDGFIHLSTWEQLPGTLEKHFKNKPDLLLIAVNETAIKGKLKYEQSRGGDLFPHLYGQLILDEVIWVKRVERALQDGNPETQTTPPENLD